MYPVSKVFVRNVQMYQDVHNVAQSVSIYKPIDNIAERAIQPVIQVNLVAQENASVLQENPSAIQRAEIFKMTQITADNAEKNVLLAHSVKKACAGSVPSARSNAMEHVAVPIKHVHRGAAYDENQSICHPSEAIHYAIQHDV